MYLCAIQQKNNCGSHLNNHNLFNFYVYLTLKKN